MHIDSSTHHQTAPIEPSNPTNANNELSPAEQEELAIEHAPILYFHPNEENFTQDPATFIEQSTITTGDSGETIYDHNDENPAAIGEESAEDVRAGDLDNSKLLYEYDAETNTITYYQFYSYNNGPSGAIGQQQNHEGDWESVTVQLDDRQQPTEVRYSAHDGLDVSRPWSEVSTEDGRPVVYVAQGSHANFPEPGEWATQLPVGGPIGAIDDASGGGQRVDTASLEPIDVTQQSYYEDNENASRWGEQGHFSFTSGPTGPGTSADHKGPILEEEASARQPNEPMDLDDILGPIRFNDFIPDVSLPDISVPDVSLPDVSLPDVSLPDVSLPDISVPKIW